jgi:hypothetical protein
VRSVLDMFAYDRESDQSLVIAAGIPDGWLDGEGIAVSKLRTPHGLLSYTLRREKDGLLLHIDEGLTLPAGGIVLRAGKKESRVRKLPASLRIKG